MILMQLEAHLIVLFPGVEVGGSDPLWPVEGCVTGLTEELPPTAGPQSHSKKLALLLSRGGLVPGTK